LIQGFAGQFERGKAWKRRSIDLEVIHPFEEKEKKVLEELGRSVDYWKDYV